MNIKTYSEFSVVHDFFIENSEICSVEIGLVDYWSVVGDFVQSEFDV